MVMRVPELYFDVGPSIAPKLLFAQIIVLGSPHGLDASCIRCACLRNPDGFDVGALYLLDEPDGHRADMASTGHCQAERRYPHAGDQVRRLGAASFSLSTTCPRLLQPFS